MNKQKRGALCLVCLLFLLTAGCQAVQKQGAETAEIVSEGKLTCKILNLVATNSLRYHKDPVLGYVERGYGLLYALDCDNQYIDGQYVGIQDGWRTEQEGAWSAMLEGITNERGVWKGTSSNPGGMDVHFEFLGEGKYEGLALTYDYDLNKHELTYRLTKVSSE
jgi:hypothetical protein